MTSDATPVMDDADRCVAQELSLQHLHPPVRLPGYEQERFIGRGAFGQVWMAVNSSTGCKVAIKFYSRRGNLDWSLLAREVEKLRYLFTDLHAVQLLEVGWDADPPYYVMQYMENGSLEDKLHAGALPIAEAVDTFQEIAVGLLHAHAKGILHCDLKPANILLDQDYRPRLADFGQSRLSEEHSAALGTLFYMAPEQADLQAAPDARWDVYALGAILYRMLTGEAPYRSDAAADTIMQAGQLAERLERYRRLLTESPPAAEHRRVPGVDRALAEIIDRCLAVKPRARYANVQAVLEALRRRAERRARRPLLLLGTLGPALVMLVMGVAAAVLYRETVNAAKEELVDRALEANRFAAGALAQAYGREIARSWGILEREADDPVPRRLLTSAGGFATDRTVCDALQAWLDARKSFWDQRAPNRAERLSARWWSLDDSKGYLRASTRPNNPEVSRYFGFRDYFHGLGRDLDRHGPTPSPIKKPHLSIPFLDREDNAGPWSVGFSVPIWNLDKTEPVGVLCLLVYLEEIPLLEGTRHRVSALIDTRLSQDGKPGMILQHPYLGQVRAENGTRAGPFYNGKIGDLEYQLRQRPRASIVAHAARTEDPPARQDRDYRDPFAADSRDFAGPWLAGWQPVLVPDRPEDMSDTGWVIVVQEHAKEALRPLDELSRQLVFLAAISFVVVSLVVLALWGVVWLMQADARGMRWLGFLRRRLGLPTDSGLSGRSSNVQTPSTRSHSGAT